MTGVDYLQYLLNIFKKRKYYPILIHFNLYICIMTYDVNNKLKHI